jgi:hypothetical protein
MKRIQRCDAAKLGEGVVDNELIVARAKAWSETIAFVDTDPLQFVAYDARSSLESLLELFHAVRGDNSTGEDSS